MTLQTLKFGRREYVLLPKRDFEKLAADAQRHREDEFWTQSALAAEARARSKNQKPIPFEQVEHELDARKRITSNARARRRR